ncbi:CLUMA_CG000611, isoform A [Clunio marinus]|uniref:CLUMA_CG000611, isoform A n=1 Tax=Clunio marinus TaxID=568069 RepID=A0A1J1HH86_9DIPT|nr:CLUMA_CG000611, isoform A [Clunio marinus]
MTLVLLGQETIAGGDSSESSESSSEPDLGCTRKVDLCRKLNFQDCSPFVYYMSGEFCDKRFVEKFLSAKTEGENECTAYSKENCKGESAAIPQADKSDKSDPSDQPAKIDFEIKSITNFKQSCYIFKAKIRCPIKLDFLSFEED